MAIKDFDELDNFTSPTQRKITKKSVESEDFIDYTYFKENNIE